MHLKFVKDGFMYNFNIINFINLFLITDGTLIEIKNMQSCKLLDSFLIIILTMIMQKIPRVG